MGCVSEIFSVLKIACRSSPCCTNPTAHFFVIKREIDFYYTFKMAESQHFLLEHDLYRGQMSFFCVLCGGNICVC